MSFTKETSTSTCFVSVVFPKNEIYFKDFLKSLEEQSDKDFTLLLFNDGVQNIEKYFQEVTFKSEIVNVKGSIAEVRTFLLDYLKQSRYEYLIFGDTDDFFSANRVELSKSLLNTNDVIISDLNIVDLNGNLVQSNFWKNRKEVKEKISLSSILNYNFLGLGNTAIKRNVIPENTIFSDEILAIDWVLFSRILKISPKVVFSSESIVNYRQHNDNIVGRKSLTLEEFKKGFLIKWNHYKFLANENKLFLDKYKEYNAKKELVKNMTILTFEKEINNPFWWEEINIDKL